MIQPTPVPTKVVRIACRALTARAMLRELECVRGPWDGERRVLDAGECSIDLPTGRYVAVVCIVNGRSNERLQWTDED